MCPAVHGWRVAAVADMLAVIVYVPVLTAAVSSLKFPLLSVVA